MAKRQFLNRWHDKKATYEFESSLRGMSIAGRLEVLDRLFHGVPIVDENGLPTGERTAPLITKEQYLRFIDCPPLEEDETPGSTE